MIASSSAASLVTATAIGAVFLIAGVSLHAQEANPQPAAAPVSILPNNVTTPIEPASDGDAIAVGDLTAPTVERIGLVDVAKGGFPGDLWAGTDAETLKQLLPQMPRHTTSHVQRRLAENLLLSPGVPPTAPVSPPAVASAADAPAPVVHDTTPWLLEARTQALGALGDWVDVLALLELVPADQMTDTLRRLRTDGQLATDHVSAACGDAQAALKTSVDSYWQKVQVFCQLSSDQASAAGLGLGVLREQRLDDPAFFWLAEMMQGGRPAPPQNLTMLQPLHIAMLRRASGAMPESLLNGVDPTTLGALAALPLADQNADPADKTPPAAKRERLRLATEARMLLAERALAAGTLKPDALRALYRQWDPKLDPSPPSLTKVLPDDVRGRALLFQSAQLQTVPTARAEVISRAIALARSDHGENGPDLIVVGKVYAPLLAEMETGADLLWFSGDAARALLAAGEEEKAKIWLDVARNMARTSSDAAIITDNLWPIERLLAAEPAPQFSSRAFKAWAATVPDAAAARQRACALNLLLAVGEHVTIADWQPLTANLLSPEPTPMVAPAVWNGLVAAARTKSTGEAALFSLIALGEAGPGRASFATAHQVIATLVAVGRQRDARAVALEAALVQGL